MFGRLADFAVSFKKFW